MHSTQIIDAVTLTDVGAARQEAAASGNATALRAAVQAERAALDANAGRLDDARRALAAVLDSTEDPRLLFLGFQFYFRTASAPAVDPAMRSAWLDEAERLVQRRLRIAEATGNRCVAGRACTNLGLVLQYKGEPWHAEAELHFKRAVDVDRQLGNQEGVARDLGNLGNFYESTGAAARAEPLYREALQIAREIGAPRLVASLLANLGDVAASRGQRVEARRLWSEAAEICREIPVEKWLHELERKLAESDPGYL